MGQINSSQQRLFQEREVGRKQAVYPFKFIRRFFADTVNQSASMVRKRTKHFDMLTDISGFFTY